MKIVTLLATAVVSLAPSLGRADDSLVRFKGGIGVDGVSGAPGTDPTAASVTRNIVRGVQPGGAPWVIADFRAEVQASGRITAVPLLRTYANAAAQLEGCRKTVAATRCRR